MGRVIAVVLALAAMQAARTVWDGVYSAAQAKRGEAIYAERCASCHAPDLSGIDQAAPLVGADFLTEWNDLALNDLFERIQVSMPADKPGSLDRQQTADVLTLILQKNTLPAGAADLATTADALKAVKVVVRKP